MAELYLRPFGGLFMREPSHGRPRLTPHPTPPGTLPDPRTGRALKIATVETAGAICPACEQHAEGGFVSFEADLRMVFACPECQEMVWVTGA